MPDPFGSLPFPPREPLLESDEFALAAQIRDQCLRWLDLHRAHCPETSCLEPAGFLAYLAHCMGLNDAQLKQFPRLLVGYDMRCGGCGSARDRPQPNELVNGDWFPREGTP